MAGVLFLIFGMTQALHPLVDAQHKLYPTGFLRRPIMTMLQLLVFMSSVSLLVSPASYVLNCLHTVVLNTTLDPNILHTTLLPIHSGQPLSLALRQLIILQYLGFLSSRLSSPPSTLRDYGSRILIHEWSVNGEAWLLHAMVPFRWRTCAHRLYSLVYVRIPFTCSNSSAYRASKIPSQQLLQHPLFTDTLS